MSSVTLAGNITADPELIFTASGMPIVNFTVVESWKKKDSDERESHFYDCKMFGQAAEHLAESAMKGDTVLVIGRLTQEKWQTKDGDNRSAVRVIANDAGLSVRWNPVNPVRTERS